MEKKASGLCITSVGKLSIYLIVMLPTLPVKMDCPVTNEAEKFMTHRESISGPVYAMYHGQWVHHINCDNPIDFFHYKYFSVF